MTGHTLTLHIENLTADTLRVVTSLAVRDAVTITRDAATGDTLTIRRPENDKRADTHTSDPARAGELLANLATECSATCTLLADSDGQTRIYPPGAWPAVRLDYCPHIPFNLR